MQKGNDYRVHFPQKEKSVLPNLETEERLENVLFVYNAARTAVGRQQEAPVQS